MVSSQGSSFVQYKFAPKWFFNLSVFLTIDAWKWQKSNYLIKKLKWNFYTLGNIHTLWNLQLSLWLNNKNGTTSCKLSSIPIGLLIKVDMLLFQIPTCVVACWEFSLLVLRIYSWCDCPADEHHTQIQSALLSTYK